MDNKVGEVVYRNCDTTPIQDTIRRAVTNDGKYNDVVPFIKPRMWSFLEREYCATYDAEKLEAIHETNEGLTAALAYMDLRNLKGEGRKKALINWGQLCCLAYMKAAENHPKLFHKENPMLYLRDLGV